MSLEEAQALARASITLGIKCTFVYLIVCTVFFRLDVHRRFGFFRTAQPRVHYITSLKTWWVPFLWGIGLTLAMKAFGIDPGTLRMEGSPLISLKLPDEYVFVHSTTIFTHIMFAVIGFYLVDLADWSAHRVNHYYDVLYKKFPVGHYVHHNHVFVNPLVVVHSPLVHLAQLSGLTVYLLMLSQGLVASVFLLHVVKMVSNFLSHLGCDPLPWLTRLNHRVGGWIPWIPLHHQYHHLPFATEGNYGNVTCLWDYVFGTVVPESVYHIKNGHATPEIQARMANADAEMTTYLAGKTGLSMA